VFNLSWKTHLSTLAGKAQKMINGLRILRRTLNHDEILWVITSQYYGRLFYAIAVWYSALTIKMQNRLDILHYKTLRVAIKDYIRIYPREMLDLLSRQKPKVLAEYMLGSFLINCYKTGSPKRLHAMIKEHEYTISRTGKIRFFDSSRRRIGHQAIYNRLDALVTKHDNSWTNLQKKDSVRIYLKKFLFK